MSRAATLYRLLEGTGILAFARRVGGRDLILCYHNVIAPGERAGGDASLHLSADAFDEQLRWVRSHFSVVPLTELLGAPRAAGTALRASITFDDAYAGVLAFALPRLRALSLPSTIFVTTRASDRPRHFWWDLVATLRPDVDRVRLRDRHGGQGEKILAASGLDGGERPLSDLYLPSTWDALLGCAGSDLTYGTHTLTHPMLSTLDGVELRRELSEARATIGSRLPGAIDVVAYPYGDTSPAVARAASETGFLAGLTISGGRVGSATEPFACPRLNVPSSMPQPAFAAAASGVRFGGVR